MKICVYGTLKQGGRLNHLMRGARFMGPSSFPGQLFSLGSFPAARPPEESDDVIHCEVWDCADALVERLDRVEGHPWMYERQKVWTPEFGECQAYIYQRHVRGADRIKSGRFEVGPQS